MVDARLERIFGGFPWRRLRRWRRPFSAWRCPRRPGHPSLSPFLRCCCPFLTSFPAFSSFFFYILSSFFYGFPFLSRFFSIPSDSFPPFLSLLLTFASFYFSLSLISLSFPPSLPPFPFSPSFIFFSPVSSFLGPPFSFRPFGSFLSSPSIFSSFSYCYHLVHRLIHFSSPTPNTTIPASLRPSFLAFWSFSWPA